jgi:hypothetical protein
MEDVSERIWRTLEISIQRTPQLAKGQNICSLRRSENIRWPMHRSSKVKIQRAPERSTSVVRVKEHLCEIIQRSDSWIALGVPWGTMAEVKKAQTLIFVFEM